MYRILIPFLLCVSAVLSAPQQNSNITYVKRIDQPKPVIPSEVKPSVTEPKIEIVPLIIPENIDKKDKESIEEQKSNENATKIQTAEANNTQAIYNYSDRIYSIKTKPKTNSSITEKSIPSNKVVEVEESEIKTTEVVPDETTASDIVPAESILNDRVVNNEDSKVQSEIVATESAEIVTQKYEEELTVNTEAITETTKAPIPKFLPKLSHYGKSSRRTFSQNLIANSGKRKFRSRCKCEKIWNCAKLQISVPRCPEEYFLCCS